MSNQSYYGGDQQQQQQGYHYQGYQSYSEFSSRPQYEGAQSGYGQHDNQQSYGGPANQQYGGENLYGGPPVNSQYQYDDSSGYHQQQEWRPEDQRLYHQNQPNYGGHGSEYQSQQDHNSLGSAPAGSNYPDNRGNEYPAYPNTVPAGYSSQQPYSAANYGNHSPYPPTGPPAYPGPDTSSYPLAQQYPTQPYPGQPPTAEEDRGLTGALAGGALGAYGGHKLNHGFIGAMGGAYAGHKLQDTLSEEKKKKKAEKLAAGRPHRRDSGSSSSSSSSGSSGRSSHHHAQQQFRGNFSASSEDVSLDKDGNDLIARCRSVDGSLTFSSISLSEVLTNSDGRFRWQRNGGFRASARNVHLVDGGRVLRAELGDGRGGWNRDEVRLDEMITNNNGSLEFVG
ncbi:CNVH-domain-containing protein [Aureobasidium pullulans]|uniref:CNVH-domain-containing protein n=1 Tax=Aureobasidium pullulans TaxID=5580 RepID=A0A4S8S3S5_AURPU|nr:CNVH-domain-containing protein [Aureobasidium pullulans]